MKKEIISSWVTLQINCTLLVSKWPDSLTPCYSECDRRGDSAFHQDLHVASPGWTCTALPLICVRTEEASHVFSWQKSLHVFILGLALRSLFPREPSLFLMRLFLTEPLRSVSSSTLILKVPLLWEGGEPAENPNLKKYIQARKGQLWFQRRVKCFRSLLNYKLNQLISVFYGWLHFLIWKKNVSSCSLMERHHRLDKFYWSPRFLQCISCHCEHLQWNFSF